MSVDVTEIPIEHAAEQLQLPPEILAHLVRCDVLDGRLARNLNTLGWCDLEQAVQLARQLAEARAPVEGNPILVSEAAEKYGFDRNSIYSWVDKGWVHVLQPEPRVRVNEGDMAFARALAELVGKAPGRGVFPPKPRSGRPRKERG